MTRLQAIDQAIFQRSLRKVAAGLTQQFIEPIRVAFDGAGVETARPLHLGRIFVPKHVQEGEIGFLGLRRHVIANEWFDRRLERPDTEDMGRHLQLLEKRLYVGAVRAVAVKNDIAIVVHEDFVSMRSQRKCCSWP